MLGASESNSVSKLEFPHTGQQKKEFQTKARPKNKGKEGANKSSKVNLVLPLLCSLLLNDMSHAAFETIPVKDYVLPSSSSLGTLLGKNNYFFFS